MLYHIVQFKIYCKITCNIGYDSIVDDIIWYDEITKQMVQIQYDIIIIHVWYNIVLYNLIQYCIFWNESIIYIPYSIYTKHHIYYTLDILYHNIFFTTRSCIIWFNIISYNIVPHHMRQYQMIWLNCGTEIKRDLHGMLNVVKLLLSWLYL